MVDQGVSDMRVELHGTSFTAVLEPAEVNEWALAWPCFGRTDKPLEAQYDARNGDLLDVDGDDGLEERGVVALLEDVLLAAALRLKLDSAIALHFGDWLERRGPMKAIEAAEYAPQWGSFIRAGDQGAVMYSRLTDDPAAVLAHVESVLIPEADASPYPEHAFDPIELRRLAAYLKAL
jgi:hypothetical protein